jgi:hypothetical protein
MMAWIGTQSDRKLITAVLGGMGIILMLIGYPALIGEIWGSVRR